MKKMEWEKEYRRSCYGEKPTHAVCDCGIVTKINDNHHACVWAGLVKKAADDAAKED